MRTWTTLALAVALPLLAGCLAVAGAAVGAAIGVGAYKYANNWLSRDYQAALDPVYDAALRGLGDAGVEVTERTQKAQEAAVDGRTATGDAVRVRLSRVDDRTTRVDVSVGTFESDANRRAAERIHEAIRNAFEDRPPARP